MGLSANVLLFGRGFSALSIAPESHLAPYVVDTGDIPADTAVVAGVEFAWVHGPWSLQTEYLHAWIQGASQTIDYGSTFPQTTSARTLTFDGFYASAGWFLTGESRSYDPVEGVFSRTIPRHDFTWGHGGWGAVELAGRYSFVNLNSADVQGGRLSMLMAGVNWYPHSHVKVRFDYGFGHVSDRTPEGDMHIFQSRVEIDF